eukprot:Hpha_TRINITY_DN15329_c5_g1::TRINITY_DN15329_c5_g1_i2::g.89463::m.89463
MRSPRRTSAVWAHPPSYSPPPSSTLLPSPTPPPPCSSPGSAPPPRRVPTPVRTSRPPSQTPRPPLSCRRRASTPHPSPRPPAVRSPSPRCTTAVSGEWPSTRPELPSLRWPHPSRCTSTPTSPRRSLSSRSSRGRRCTRPQRPRPTAAGGVWRVGCPPCRSPRRSAPHSAAPRLTLPPRTGSRPRLRWALHPPEGSRPGVRPRPSAAGRARCLPHRRRRVSRTRPRRRRTTRRLRTTPLCTPGVTSRAGGECRGTPTPSTPSTRSTQVHPATTRLFRPLPSTPRPTPRREATELTPRRGTQGRPALRCPLPSGVPAAAAGVPASERG